MDKDDEALVEEIVESGTCSARFRLRLLLDAGIHILGVDSISALITPETTPFRELFTSELLTKEMREALPKPKLWPFYFSGLYDPVPMYCTLSPSRIDELIGKENRGQQSEQFASFSAGTAPYGFADREHIRCSWILHLYEESKTGTAESTEPLLLLFFNKRTKGNDILKEDCIKFGKQCRNLVNRMKDEVAKTKSSRATRYLDALVDLETLLSRLNTSDANSKDKDSSQHAAHQLVLFAEGLLSICLFVLENPELKSLFLSTATRNGEGEHATYQHTTRKPKSEITVTDTETLVLCPISEANYGEFEIGPHQTEYTFSSLETAMARAKQNTEAYRKDCDLVEPEPWFYLPPPQFGNQASLSVLAAYLGTPLFMEDALRRYCPANRLYWSVFVEVSSEHRFSYSIPLLRITKKTDKNGTQSDNTTCIGTLTIEGPQQNVVRRDDAMFLFFLCQVSSSQLTQCIAEGDYTLKKLSSSDPFVVDEG